MGRQVINNQAKYENILIALSFSAYCALQLLLLMTINVVCLHSSSIYSFINLVSTSLVLTVMCSKLFSSTAREAGPTIVFSDTSCVGDFGGVCRVTLKSMSLTKMKLTTFFLLISA